MTHSKDSRHFAGAKKKLLLVQMLILLYFQEDEDRYFKLSRFGMCIEDLMSEIPKRVIYFLKESLKLCALTQGAVYTVVSGSG